VLGHGSQNVDCEPVCLREIDRSEFDARSWIGSPATSILSLD
jgi:hypothetical protein